MENKRITPLKQLVPSLLLGFIVMLGLLLISGIQNVSLYLLKFNLEFFALALGLTFFSNTLRFLKRAFTLRISGIKNLSFGTSLQLFLASLPLDAAPTHIGDSFKSLWLFRVVGQPAIRSASIYLLEQLSDNLSIFLLTTFGAIAYPAYWPMFVLVLLLFLLATTLLRVKHKDVDMAAMGEKLPAYKQFFQELHSCIDAHPELFSNAHLAMTFLLGVISRASEGAVFFFVLCGLGMEPTLPLAVASILIYAFSASIASITGIPGGMGVVEASMALLMTVLFDFNPGVAVAATLLFRLITFWINLGIGMLVWVVSRKKLGLINGDVHIVES